MLYPEDGMEGQVRAVAGRSGDQGGVGRAGYQGRAPGQGRAAQAGQDALEAPAEPGCLKVLADLEAWAWQLSCPWPLEWKSRAHPRRTTE